VGAIGNETNLKSELNGPRGRALRVRRAVVLAAWFWLAQVAWAQQVLLLPAGPAIGAGLPGAQEATGQEAAGELAPGSIGGVVVGPEGSVYEGAKIALARTEAAEMGANEARSTTSDSNGHFNFAGVGPGAFELTISASGFETRVVSGVLNPGESYEAQAIILRVNDTASEVRVTASREEIAQEQLKVEETQRVLGVLPNFYVSYERNPAPLTARQKYVLALKSTMDPVSFLASGAFAGQQQATNSFPGYGQGARGYGKRFGASLADNFDGTIIAGAILPSWWKQDPRYFYQGTGTVRSRAWHAIADAVMCKGDNGRRQVNYSAIVGGLAAGGISNLYYPASDRDGVGLTFESALIGAGESAMQNLFQEFVVRKLTPHLQKSGAGTP